MALLSLKCRNGETSEVVGTSRDVILRTHTITNKTPSTAILMGFSWVITISSLYWLWTPHVPSVVRYMGIHGKQEWVGLTCSGTITRIPVGPRTHTSVTSSITDTLLGIALNLWDMFFLPVHHGIPIETGEGSHYRLTELWQISVSMD